MCNEVKVVGTRVCSRNQEMQLTNAGGRNAVIDDQACWILKFLCTY